MSIILIGVSHKTAPVEVRERLAFAESRLPDALQQLVDQQTISEGVIVSTCNRVEVIAATVNHRESDSQASHLYNFLHRFHGCEPSVLSRHCYHQTDLSAIKHIFRVTASLDSMVVGEQQILGQVRQA
ncbi:MAG TPA: glutamyl-tRNA reductase, partial [Blastocatellia bacterium]|nr:glutamyl-tRNA reductase [Blastocatellia bacterium]